MSDTAPQERPIPRLLSLVAGLADAPPGCARIAFALAYGLLCHAIFAAAVLAMGWALWNGMTVSLGTVPWPWAALANAALLLQFPILHSALLNGRGASLPARAIPGPWGRTLASTSYTIFASLQLLALFALWTPSGVVWWRAEGWALWAVGAAHLASWLFLMKSNLDAGAELQSGALGWMSLAQDRRPHYPDMPVTGLFRVIRQPIYVGFSAVLWTVPVWTPDQLVLALGLTAYCVIAPRRFKERRYLARHGERFARYLATHPYMLPGRPGRKDL
ncbi:isoprenylcysteine carboxylmethyltransferase family protein [Litorisediminicola beolgyonensis]|uniref:Isoprenylcysteine carboxylmethyltransferase family protein n=1 Tax=Litorisediminicola beolgyonensis TaxID=1173614 RepID=A0ABW3ZG28_9RHOB